MFGGGGSIQLGRVLGIRIGASPSWFLVLFLMVYLLSGYFSDVLDVDSTTAYLVAVAGAACFFGSLVLHELGHALAARGFGIGTSGIDLWFFGGIAKLERDTHTPREELVVAGAGPLVTGLVIAGCVGLGALAEGYGAFEDAALLRDVDTSPGMAILGWLAVVNAFLLVFNLVPAFPLDGGRIARAVAWRATGDKHRATRASAYVGQAFAILLLGLGVFLALQGAGLDGLWLGVLGWFLLQAARGAVTASRFTERLEGVTAADLMDTEPVTLPGDVTAVEASDTYFARYRWPWFCVVEPASGRFLGVATQERVDAALADGRPALPVAELVDPGTGTDLRIPTATPLESLLVHEPLRRLGALAVVDPQDRLVGVLTVETVRRALAANAAPRTAS
jgi:Zn-dependent protease